MEIRLLPEIPEYQKVYSANIHTMFSTAFSAALRQDFLSLVR